MNKFCLAEKSCKWMLHGVFLAVTAFVALFAFAGAANAAEIFTANPSSVEVAVGETVSVTLTNNTGNDAEPRMGSNDKSGEVTTRAFGCFTATLPSGSRKIGKNGGTQILNITGTTVTSEPQTLTFYKDDNNYSSIQITVIEKRTVEFQNQTISYVGATCTTADNGELIMAFTGSGWLELPWDAIADCLVVGGGGGGGRSGTDSKANDQFGTSGNGGQVKSAENVVLSAEAFAIQVGSGGSAAADQKKYGVNGGDSSIAGTSFSETASGGAGGYGADSDNVGGAGTPTSGSESSITGTPTVYGTGGAAAYVVLKENNKDVDHKVTGEAGAPNTGNGGMGGDKNSVAGAGGSGIVVVRVKTFLTDAGTKTVAVGEAPVSLPWDASRGEIAEVFSRDETKASVAFVNGEMKLTGLAPGETAVVVKTADGTYYRYTVYVAAEPHDVDFCEGDSVKIWYHNPEPKNWFLLINDTRYALNEPGAGEQMNVTLSHVARPDVDGKTTDTAIVADAVRPTSGTTDGDLVVISDGVNYYAYRMSCAPLREIPIGGSTNMTCSTVAVNKWKAAATARGEDYSEFIDIEWTNAETPDHSTKVTITGKELTDEAYVQAWDNEFDSAEENAQGAVYTLKVAVVGVPTIDVNLSSGVKMPVAWGARHATEATRYTVEKTGDYAGLTATLTRNTGTSFELELSAEGAAPGMADFGKTATFTVLADGEPVVEYRTVVTYQFAMTVGQTAPGYLTGVKKTPWVTTSSDPSVVSVRPVLYNQLHSGEAKALKEGTATFYSTNAYWQAGYWGIYATVADEHITDISIPKGTTTNLTVNHVGTFAGVWAVSNPYENLVTASIPASTEPAKSVEVTLTAGETVGPATIKVTNGFHTEYINVFVDDENTAGKTKVIVPGKFTVVKDGSVTLPADCVATGWTAWSSNTDLVTVDAASGTAGTQVKVNGISASDRTPDGKPTSEALVTVMNDTHIYVYQVGVVKPEETNRDVGTLTVGQTVEMPTSLLGTVTGVTAVDPMVVSCALQGDKIVITGLQEGMTTLRVETADKVYFMTVTVRTSHIDKKIELVIGKDTSSSYSYTFDSNISWVSNGAPDRVEAVVDGRTITFKAKGLPGTYEEAQVMVGGFVDGLQTETALHYWIAIKEAEAGANVWTKEGGTGYVTYSGAAEVHDNGDELILVYTNANALGGFSVPAPYTAKADILAVGGGGGGGSTLSFGQGGGGGGAGGYTLVDDKRLTGGSYTVTVGAGGSAGNVATLHAAAQGSNGGDSFITNQVGYAYASAKGGGGGAAPLNAIAANGSRGGSGGGAVWMGGICGMGGSGIGGQGASGGAPTKNGTGGGGGGAGGAGSADMTGGAGKESDITGEAVLYSQGGTGGRNDTAKLAAEVEGPGFGGNGGNGGPGSDGADGVVIVRITDIYRNIKVPIPTTNDILRTGFTWQEGETYAGLVYDDKSEFRSSTDAHHYRWADVIESVTGVTSTNCTLSATELDAEDGGFLKLGAGYHNFSIKLKDGYTWEDNGGSETYGETGTLSFRWTISKEGTVKVAAIDVTKAVTWNDTSNATVTITTYSTPEASAKRRDGVLVLGSLCTSHGFNSNVWVKAAQAIADVSDADYYFWLADPDDNGGFYYGNKVPLSDVNEEYNGKCAFYGHLDKGDTYEYTQGLVADDHEVGGMHGTYLYFVDMLYHVMQAEKSGGKKYGYIVMSFDGTKLADNKETSGQIAADQLNIALQNSQHPHAKEVAEWLAENFYKDGSVIWLTADGYSTTGGVNGDGAYTDPSGTSLLTPILDPYLYLNTLAGNATRKNATGDAKLELYPDQEYWTYAYPNDKGVWTTVQNIYANQVYYGNADEVAQFLKSRIKVKPYNMELTDKIVSPDKGLTIQSMTIQACTNGTDRVASTNEADWVDLISWDRATGESVFLPTTLEEGLGIPAASLIVDIVSNNTTTVISNVDFDVWSRIRINVLDDGKFRRSADAVFNEMTGMWEKNPNEGKAFAELVGNDGISMKVDGDAETQVPWSFTAYPVTAIVHGGEAYVDGQDSDKEWIGEGLSCSVYYRGYGGYKLTKVIVDDTTELTGAALDDFLYSYTFENVEGPRKIEIFYEPFFGTVSSAPVTNVYDGAVHLFDVTREGWDESVSNEVRYALWEDRDDPEKYLTAEEFKAFYEAQYGTEYNPEELTDVGDHPIAYRVFALQPGYGKTWTEEGWVWVNESKWQAIGENCGEDHSVILPAPLLARPEGHGAIAVDDDPPADIGISIKGLVDGETLEDVIGDDATNGWRVVTSFEKGMPEGPYPTWILDGSHEPLVEGDPSVIDPALDDGNIGNYYLVPAENFLPVVRIPFEIGDVPQGPGLDPEKPGMDTGVDPVEKIYDGVSTGLVVDVTSVYPGDSTPLVPGVDYTITWAIGDPDDPSTPPADGFTLDDEPTFLHVGTNVVWYYVESNPDSERMEGLYFAASNYNYVIIHPRPLVIESPTDTKVYDGTPLVRDATTIVEGSLAGGDTLTTNTFASVTDVGSVTNTFGYTIASGDTQFTGNAADDYDITVRYGTLTVTPAHYTIGGVEYDNPDNPPPYGTDPETGKSTTGVEDAYRVYDGTPTNIVVNVTVPVEDEQDDYDIWYKYTTDGGDTYTEWSTDLPLFTNVVDATVYFQVVPKGGSPSEGNYLPAENFARVQVVPAPVTVTADDVTILLGDEKPEKGAYTATTGKLACDEDEAKKAELIDQHTETLDIPGFTTDWTAGDYPDAIQFVDLPTVITQGNYAVTYVPGTLHVVTSPSVVALWITDHADAGDGSVHLQFEPSFDVRPKDFAAWATEANEKGRFWVFRTDKPDDIEKVTKAETERAAQATIRNNKEPIDVTMGRIWITFKLPQGSDGKVNYDALSTCKIVILNE